FFSRSAIALALPFRYLKGEPRQGCHLAPDIAALATKLEAAVAAELADLTYAPPALAALAEDARRLSRP
ncbi:MAG: hypothetical protein QOI38_53, partial [Sphingomonadales bacterium]|nr:hypothetical protein [Sphingomonadales bacterium]